MSYLFNYYWWSHLMSRRVVPQTHPTAAFMLPGGEPNPSPWRAGAETYAAMPYPLPWVEVTGGIIDAVSLREVAAAMPEGPARTAAGKRSGSMLAEIEDFVCGSTGPHHPPGWPKAAVDQVAAGLIQAANTLEKGALRTGLVEVAARIVQRAFEA